MISVTTESEIDRLEPSPSSKMLQNPKSSDMVYDAFHLLETEPSVQVCYIGSIVNIIYVLLSALFIFLSFFYLWVENGGFSIIR